MEPKDIVLELKLLGMTQVEIAHAAGCSQATISDIENGRQKRGPSYNMVVRLRELLEKKRAESIADRSQASDDVQNNPGGSVDKTKRAKLSNG